MCSVKNRLALLFALLVLVPVAHAQNRRRAALPPLRQPVNGCSPASLPLGAYSSDFEIDATHIYFTDGEGGIFRTPKSSTTLAPPEHVADVPDFIIALELDATNVYAIAIDTEGVLGDVWSVPKSGGTPKQLVNDTLTPYDLAVDANSVYWVSVGTPTDESFLADGKVERVMKDGTGRLTLASNLNVPAAIDTDGTNVYFGESGLSFDNTAAGLRSVPVGGGAVRTITDGTGVVSLTLHDNDIFFSTIDFFAGGALARMTKSATTPTVLLRDIDIASRVVVSDDRVYFFNAGDTERIESIAAAGGDRKEVVPSTDTGFMTDAFAVDDCALFWGDGSGNLNRTPV